MPHNPLLPPQDKDGYTEALQQELRAAQEELGVAQRRAKAMQTEADAGELELSRRDLRIKVGLHVCARVYACVG